MLPIKLGRLSQLRFFLLAWRSMDRLNWLFTVASNCLLLIDSPQRHSQVLQVRLRIAPLFYQLELIIKRRSDNVFGFLDHRIVEPSTQARTKSWHWIYIIISIFIVKRLLPWLDLLLILILLIGFKLHRCAFIWCIPVLLGYLLSQLFELNFQISVRVFSLFDLILESGDFISALLIRVYLDFEIRWYIILVFLALLL